MIIKNFINYMQIQIGKIYKIKKGSEGKCGSFQNAGGEKIKIKNIKSNFYYNILSKDNLVVGNCRWCFGESDLEEETTKTLFNLGIGDEVRDINGGVRKVLSVLPSDPENLVYILSDSSNFKHSIGFSYTAEELKDKNFTIITPEPQKQIKEMTVEEVSKLVGCEVKIIGDNK